jgi:hypothetical protein
VSAAFYALGVDLAQTTDFHTQCCIEFFAPPGSERGLWEPPPAELRVVDLQRLQRGMSYTDQAGRIIYTKQRIGHACDVVVDATGVGRPVVDLLRSRGLDLVACTLTSGKEPTITKVRGGWDVSLPKALLVASLRVSLEQHPRLRISNRLPLARALVDEMLTFETRITAAGNETTGAVQGAHDDLVIACGLAVWWLTRKKPVARVMTLNFNRR